MDDARFPRHGRNRPFSSGDMPAKGGDFSPPLAGFFWKLMIIYMIYSCIRIYILDISSLYHKQIDFISFIFNIRNLKIFEMSTKKFKLSPKTTELKKFKKFENL